jgi:hypothetical protein
MMAFGREWQNREKLKEVCSEIALMKDSKAWKHLESLAAILIENQKDKFCGMTTIEQVRENAGIIAGIKKILAIPIDCEQLLAHKDKPTTGD